MDHKDTKVRVDLRGESGYSQALNAGHDSERQKQDTSTIIETSRLLRLMQSLQRVAKLQEQLTNAQIDFRQKRREATFKRENVWDCDAKFMREIQKLMAQGLEDSHGNLIKLRQLAVECQASRDILGPVEQENIEAEQRWEGQIWSLRQAENHICEDFELEFSIAKSYPPVAFSEKSSLYESPSEAESGTIEEERLASQSRFASSTAAVMPQASATNIPRQDDAKLQNTTISALSDTALLGFENEAGPQYGNIERLDSESGTGDIEHAPMTWNTRERREPWQQLPARQYSSELYPMSFTDFGTKRDRINKWLESSALASRIEATSVFTILRDRLNAENKEVPSNWAQLVIAYWELDGAAIPGKLPHPPVEYLPEKRSESNLTPATNSKSK